MLLPQVKAWFKLYWEIVEFWTKIQPLSFTRPTHEAMLGHAERFFLVLSINNSESGLLARFFTISLSAKSTA